MTRFVVPDSERMISSREATQIVGLSRQSIDKLAAKGVIPSYRPAGGKRVTFRVGDLYAWREQHRRNLSPSK